MMIKEIVMIDDDCERGGGGGLAIVLVLASLTWEQQKIFSK